MLCSLVVGVKQTDGIMSIESMNIITEKLDIWEEYGLENVEEMDLTGGGLF